MIDERLINYIKNGLEKGYSLNSLRQALINSGWDINQVNEAIDYVRNYSLSTQTHSQTLKHPVTRPTGITVICVLGFLFSIFMLIMGIILLGFAPMLGNIEISTEFVNQSFSATLGGFTPLFYAFGLITLIISIVAFIAFYLLWKMKKTGLIIVIIVGIISIIQSLISFNTNNIIGIVLWIIIIGYLWTKRNLFV